MTSPEHSEGKLAFSKWKYRHYFNLLEVKGKNLHVKCTLCPGAKCLSTSVVSNSNLMKHLSTAHTSTKLVAINTVVDTVNDDSRPDVANVSSVLSLRRKYLNSTVCLPAVVR